MSRFARLAIVENFVFTLLSLFKTLVSFFVSQMREEKQVSAIPDVGLIRGESR